MFVTLSESRLSSTQSHSDGFILRSTPHAEMQFV